MTKEQLRPRRLKYDVREFHQWNFGVRMAIREYDAQIAAQQQSGYPKARRGADGERICADLACDVVLEHQRSFLCEAHREGRYQAAKAKAYELQRRRDVQETELRDQDLPSVPTVDA